MLNRRWDKTFDKEATEKPLTSMLTLTTLDLCRLCQLLWPFPALGGVQDVRSCCAWDIVSHWRYLATGSRVTTFKVWDTFQIVILAILLYLCLYARIRNTIDVCITSELELDLYLHRVRCTFAWNIEINHWRHWRRFHSSCFNGIRNSFRPHINKTLLDHAPWTEPSFHLADLFLGFHSQKTRAMTLGGVRYIYIYI